MPGGPVRDRIAEGPLGAVAGRSRTSAVTPATTEHTPDGLRMIVGPLPAESGGKCPLSWLPPRQVTSAVTPAPAGRASGDARIVVCRNTPYRGYSDTRSRAPWQLWHFMRAPSPQRSGLFPGAPQRH